MMNGDNADNLMLVGIGASAGGVEALMRFFERLPADAGMAFVVVLHLSPEHESRLAEVLRPGTQMPVEQVNEPVRVERNRVYVIPPDRNLYMADGQIRLAERAEDGERRAPIDLFFRTLADSYKERAIAVVLSGAGADGSVGVRRVKEQGGVSIAQDPAEAEHGAMPRGAVETGAVDFVLPVAEIPAKLVSLRQNAERIQLPPVEQPRPGADEESLEPVVRQLEEELQRTQEQLRATVEMYETQAEEFRAANEELQATNEELRSASEELETGKDELQSVNEELERFNRAAVGHELRMVELKKEVNALLARLGEPARYNLEFEGGASGGAKEK